MSMMLKFWNAYYTIWIYSIRVAQVVPTAFVIRSYHWHVQSFTFNAQFFSLRYRIRLAECMHNWIWNEINSICSHYNRCDEKCWNQTNKYYEKFNGTLTSFFVQYIFFCLYRFRFFSISILHKCNFNKHKCSGNSHTWAPCTQTASTRCDAFKIDSCMSGMLYISNVYVVTSIFAIFKIQMQSATST